MKLKHSFACWLAIGLLSVACGKKESASVTEAPVTAKKPPTDEKLHWLTDFEAAKAEARSEDKLLLINFTGSDWCPPCMMLEKDLFSKPEFAQYSAKHLVLLEVDFPRRKKLSAEQQAANAKVAGDYGIEGFPTVIVLAPDSKPLGKFGYVPGLTPAKVIDVLEKARSGK
ncbi:MAG: thioredoxin family protein [Chthoniobacterales bacterium]